MELNSKTDAPKGDAQPLHELSELIERGDEQGVADFLARHSDLETVFLPHPPLQFDSKVLLPSVFYAIKSNNLQLFKLLYEHDESFICDEDEEQEKLESNLSSYAWGDAFVGFNVLHLASSLGLSLTSLILMALGMDATSTTDAEHETTVFRRFSPLHIAAMQGHVHMFQTFLYFFKNQPLISKYVKQTLKGNTKVSPALFSRLPITFVHNEPLSYRPVYDYYGNLISAPLDAEATARKEIERAQLEKLETELIGDTTFSTSHEMFNHILNKRNIDGDTVLHVAAYHRKSLVLEWILQLAKNVNRSVIDAIQLGEVNFANGDAHDDAESSDSDSDESDDEGAEDSPTDRKSARKKKLLENHLQKKKRWIKIDEENDFGMTALMVAASRGFGEIVSLFADYNAFMEQELSSLLEEQAELDSSSSSANSRQKSKDEVDVYKTLQEYRLQDVFQADFGHADTYKTMDTVLHLACQSQLHRVFNYNYEPVEDHYACIYQVITRMPHHLSLEMKNVDGDLPLDLLLIPAADLFEHLHNISLTIRELNNQYQLTNLQGIEPLWVAYPTLRAFLDACHDGELAVRCVSLVRIMSQLKQAQKTPIGANATSVSSDSAVSASSPRRDATIGSTNGSAHHLRDYTLKPIVPIEEVIRLGRGLWNILDEQLHREENASAPCKLIDTSQIPYTRKFAHLKRAPKPENLANEMLASSSSSTDTESIAPPAGHPDLSKYPPGATCPMGFGKKKVESEAPPAGHPDISKYPPGATCPMGFGKKPAAAATTTTTTAATEVSGTAPSDTQAPPAGHPDISKYPPGAVCPMGYGKKKPAANGDANGDANGETVTPGSEPNSPGPTGRGYMGLVTRYLNFETVVLVGAVGLLAGLFIYRKASQSATSVLRQGVPKL